MCVQDLSWNQTLKEHHTQNRSRKSAKIRHAFKAFCLQLQMYKCRVSSDSRLRRQEKVLWCFSECPWWAALVKMLWQKALCLLSLLHDVYFLQAFKLLALGCLPTFSMTFTSVALNIVQICLHSKRNFFLFLKIRSRKLVSVLLSDVSGGAYSQEDKIKTWKY